MKTVTLRKVTIVAEAFLEERILREVRERGARGFTLTQARGEGSRGAEPERLKTVASTKSWFCFSNSTISWKIVFIAPHGLRKNFSANCGIRNTFYNYTE